MLCLGAFNGDQAGLPVMGCAVSSCIRQGDGLIECLNVGGVRRAIHGGARTLGVVGLVHSYILVSPCRNVLWVLRCTEAVSCVRCSFFIRLSVAISKGGGKSDSESESWTNGVSGPLWSSSCGVLGVGEVHGLRLESDVLRGAVAPLLSIFVVIADVFM